jgi:phage terminase small subunit
MTKKQKRFVEEYLIDLNATQAAIRAGYTPNFANTNANKLLQNTTIQTAIDKAMAERSKRTGVNADRVVLELAKLAFVNVSDFVDPNDVTIKDTASRDDLAAICSVRIKTFPTRSGELGTEREIRTYDKIRALELLGKHLGMFTDKFKIEGAIPVVIQEDLEEDDEDE